MQYIKTKIKYNFFFIDIAIIDNNKNSKLNTYTIYNSWLKNNTYTMFNMIVD